MANLVRVLVALLKRVVTDITDKVMTRGNNCMADTSYKSYWLFTLKWDNSNIVDQQNKVTRSGRTLMSLIEDRKVLIWPCVCANRGSQFWTKWVGKDHLCWQISNVTPPVALFHLCQHRCAHSCKNSNWTQMGKYWLTSNPISNMLCQQITLTV